MSAFLDDWKTQEDPELLFFERLINVAVSVGAMAFGVHMAIFAICTYHFSTKPKKFPILQQIYITVLFLLAGVTISCNINGNQLQWIDYRNYPGGPGAFILEQQGIVVNTVGNSCGLIITFMVDSLLIYRCFLVWGNNYFVIIVPILMLIASTVLSILQTIAASQPTSALWAANAVRFGLPYFSLTMTLNMLVTVIIVSRLLVARRQIRSVMGSNYGKTYTSVASMLVESALPVALVSAVLVALYAKENTAQVLFYPLLPQVQAIAPQLIFIRVHRGRAWNSNTMAETRAAAGTKSSNIKFGSNPSNQSTDGTTTKVRTSPTHSHELSNLDDKEYNRPGNSYV